MAGFLKEELGLPDHDQEDGINLSLLVKLLLFTLTLVLVYSGLFHILMLQEGRSYSFVTGIYWTVSVMTSLGLGDIAFQTDSGRLFTVLVLLSGIGMLLVVLPFAFLRFLYIPWLQNRVRMRAPRQLPVDTSGHIVLCNWAPVAEGLVGHLRERGISYVVTEPRPEVAAAMHREGISVACGDPGDVEFLRKLRIDQARLLLANSSDTINTNITLTAREITRDLRILAFASRKDSVDVLELSGANQVLTLKHWLGKRLANRVGGAQVRSQIVGTYKNFVLAEVPVRNTLLQGREIAETELRERFGISVIGIWRHSQFHPAAADFVLSAECVLIVLGRRSKLNELDDLLFYEHPNPDQVVLIGAGRVGRSAVEALTAKGVTVHVIEKDPQVLSRLQEEVHKVPGDAADIEIMKQAGLMEASTAILTTHDDAMNIYLASYCRNLNPKLRIISRITHERNVEAVHRAGADFALSYTTLGVTAVLAELDEGTLDVAGGTFELFSEVVPHTLVGKTLEESRIGNRTGLVVIALEDPDGTIYPDPLPDETLHADMRIVMIGEDAQRKRFERIFYD